MEKVAIQARQDGVTLMETIVCISIVTLLSMISVPAMQTLMSNSQINSARQRLIQDIRLVRRYALTRHRSAYLCALDAEKKCSRQAKWNDGWIGFVDNNYSHSIDPGDEIVLQYQRNENSDVDIILHARWKRIKFNSSGVVRSSGHFRVCDPDQTKSLPMQVIRMNVHGRLSVEKDKLKCT